MRPEREETDPTRRIQPLPIGAVGGVRRPDLFGEGSLGRTNEYCVPGWRMCGLPGLITQEQKIAIANGQERTAVPDMYD